MTDTERIEALEARLKLIEMKLSDVVDALLPVELEVPLFAKTVKS